MTINTDLGQAADGISVDMVDRLKQEADGDDYKLLDLLKENAEITKRHQERVWSARDEAAQRLRDAGVPMTEIADWAGVADSYLARRLIGAGGKRRVDRTRKQRRRRSSWSRD